MLNRIIDFSIKNKLIIGLLVFSLIGIGTYQFTKLPIDAVPDITNNQVQIITIAPSFGATDIERLVTFPIEQANNNIPGLIEMRSFSRFGLSLVTIVFDDNTDVYWARQQVSERLQLVKSQIPAGIGEPELGPVTTGLGEIYQYVIRPKKGYEHKYDATDLRTIQDWIVTRQLLGVKGVADVSSFGGKLKQYSVEIEPNKLQAYNLTIQDVFEALETNNQNTGGAYIERGPTVLYIRSEGLIGNQEDIRNIIIRKPGNAKPVFIRDVADVKIGHAIRYGAMTYNGDGEVAGAIVMMLKGANSNVVIKDVKDRIAHIQKTLPEGVIIEPFLDRTKMVNNAISTVEHNLLFGALIVLFVLVLFLGNLRAGLLVASVIPLSMLFAVCMMNLFGVSGNLMSLGALDFGLIVDGAVIIVEAVMHQLSKSRKFQAVNRLSQAQMNSEVRKSAGKMMNSAVFGQVIILVVYLPILTLQGIEGKMFKPMAQTVAFALLGAFILSLTYIPMMSTLVLSKKVKSGNNISDRIMDRLGQSFQNTLNKVLNFPRIVIGVVISLFAFAMFVLSTMGGEFIPSLEEGDFAVDTKVLPGSNLNTTIEYVTKTADILKTRFPEVEKVVTKIGSGEIPTDPMAMEESDMMVILKPKKEWTTAKTFNELADKMTEELQEVPGITLSFQYPVQMRFNELMTGARQDVVVKIFGEDLDTLAHYANHMSQIIQTVKGAKDIYVEPVTGMPQIVIDYNRQAIARYNTSVADINKVVNAAFAGQVAGAVFEGERHFDLVVRLATDSRRNLKDVQNLLIPLSSGQQIPLSQLASVEIKDGPNRIQREDAKRRIIVGFNVGDRDVQSIVHELKDKVKDQIVFPVGYYPSYGGAFENLEEALGRLTIAVPVALLMIFILLYFAFHSIRQGLLIYSAIPLSAIGGILFLAMRDMPFSISAGIGFIALFGIAVLNGIVLIAEFNRLRKEGLKDLREIVLKGSRTRLRPVLMTASVASLGFLPMAISQGSGAEVQRPLATVVIGGLIVATFLTLYVLPVLYVMFEKKAFAKDLQKNTVTGIVVILALCFIPQLSSGQKILTLKEAQDSAIQNSLLIRDQNLQMKLRQQLIGTAADIPNTNVNAAYGQIASVYNDSEIGFSQSISFPAVYKRQKIVLTELYELEKMSRDVRIRELKRQVAEVYNQLLYLNELKVILDRSDSIYTNFLEKANLRFERGESNVLERATAQNHQGQIRTQLEQLQSDINIYRLRLQILVNAQEEIIPVAQDFKMSASGIDTLSSASTISEIKVLMQERKVAEANTQFQRSKLLPEIIAGYKNQSMQGIGAVDVYYGSSKRFHSVQAGVGIPIFNGAQKKRIEASKTEQMIAENRIELNTRILESERKFAQTNFKKYLRTVNWYETIGLKNANAMRETANQQFLNGEINYLDWVLLINQTIDLQNQYVEAVKLFNDSIIQLNYLYND